MREFMGLYRAKRKDNGEWVEGNLLLDGYDYDTAIWETGTKLVTEVDPDTVGECTGLRDKNGKLIFEHQKFKYEGELYEIRMVCGEWRLYDKFDHYCELYKYAGSGEIVSED